MMLYVQISNNSYVHQKNQYNVKMNQSSPLVFLWMGVRPKMQVVRYLLSYLDLPYIEININKIKEELQNQPQQIQDMLLKHYDEKMDICKLPLLLHKDVAILEIYPILFYICKVFNAEYLHGRTPQQKAQVSQLLQYFHLQKHTLIESFMKLADSAYDKSKADIIKLKKVYFDEFFNDSSILKYMCKYIQRSGTTNTYILGSITIVDFIFMEISHLVMGTYGCLGQKIECPITHILINIFYQEPPEQPNLKYLKLIKQYSKFMNSHPFYQNKQELFNSFSMICQKFGENRVAGIRKIWQGHVNSVK